MIAEECIKKCKFVITVLNKMIQGVEVPLQERLDACEKAIEVLCTNNSESAPSNNA